MVDLIFPSSSTTTDSRPCTLLGTVGHSMRRRCVHKFGAKFTTQYAERRRYTFVVNGGATFVKTTQAGSISLTRCRTKMTRAERNYLEKIIVGRLDSSTVGVGRTWSFELAEKMEFEDDE